jgi:hypothetical protein
MRNANQALILIEKKRQSFIAEGIMTPAVTIQKFQGKSVHPYILPRPPAIYF